MGEHQHHDHVENILITTGSQQGLSLLSPVLLIRVTSCSRWPTYLGALLTFRSIFGTGGVATSINTDLARRARANTQGTGAHGRDAEVFVLGADVRQPDRQHDATEHVEWLDAACRYPDAKETTRGALNFGLVADGGGSQGGAGGTWVQVSVLGGWLTALKACNLPSSPSCPRGVEAYLNAVERRSTPGPHRLGGSTSPASSSRRR